MGLISGLGRFPGGRNGNPLQYSCLNNPLDRGAWWAIVHGVTESQTQLSTNHSLDWTKEWERENVGDRNQITKISN